MKAVPAVRARVSRVGAGSRSVSPSHNDDRVGQQLYATIEYCPDAETLWRRVESGHWDWLGVVKRDGRPMYVLGAPSIARSPGTVSTLIARARGTRERGRVVVQTPNGSRSESSYATLADAQAGFGRQLARLASSDANAGLYRIRLLLDGQLVDEQFVAHSAPDEP